ncbi:transporter substrate-binding domain-containing protein [Roseateles saccharophilus]|uniref:Extracellular solute-binding protein (Family 3) n=1 Tax=Roseateles saccharophilus TaxID=304 RepID=A0A4R3U9T9_ROSSA|nr:transporter substrate-binding domain-containing protein [Roseateles saccharophilus]MDG0835834.1 transporter substrate-binding domain-containing protein [Roseateles saccharophilus]TCU83419.1 extracellular solute-binding protein (family 3) [Roseateles saccharophilus]
MYSSLYPALVAANADGRDGAIPIGVSDSSKRRYVQGILDELRHVMPRDLKVHLASFPRVLEMAEQGLAVGFGIGQTAARQKTLAFSKPIFVSRVWAVSRRESSLSLQTVADLAGKQVCLRRTASYGAEVDTAAGTLFEAISSNLNLAGRLRVLTAGRCDAVLVPFQNGEISQLERRMASLGFPPSGLVISKKPIAELPQHFAVSKRSSLAAELPVLDIALDVRRLQIERILSMPDG